MTEMLRQHAEARRRVEAEAKEQQKILDREQFLDRLEKKLMTTCVGVLVAFEQQFGYLWGHNKKPAERTEDERLWLRMYQSVRDEAFDTVNKQIRGVRAEVSCHDVTYIGERMLFRPRNGSDSK